MSLVYRCKTDDRVVSLNEEHDDYEWVSPAAAAERLGEAFSARFARAVERAAALGGSEPFETVADPYADAEVTSETVLEQLAAIRASNRFVKTDQNSPSGRRLLRDA
jgi:hypothetical protein